MAASDGLTAVQAVVLSLVQGVTELFPVSSLGHAVLLPRLLNWGLDQDSPGFLPYLVVMHTGTALALLLYFQRDWRTFAAAAVLNRGPRAAAERAVFWRLVVATLPAVIAAVVLYKPIRVLFASPAVAAGFLVANGFMLFIAERMGRRRLATRRMEGLSWLDALIIGLWQCLALIPGLSRSGATMVGGMQRGLDHEDAARFSFLSGTPIILAATVHEAPKLMHMHGGFSSLAVLSGALAGAAAFASTWVLMHWFKRAEFKALDPFAWWCWAFGGVSLALFLSRLR
jgi:undecaprenyl-diphosphatase